MDNNDRDGHLCWGYEKGCTEELRLFVPHCDDPPKPWATTMEEKTELFWKQGDFGYVKQEVDSTMLLCAPPQGGGVGEIERVS